MVRTPEGMGQCMVRTPEGKGLCMKGWEHAVLLGNLQVLPITRI